MVFPKLPNITNVICSRIDRCFFAVTFALAQDRPYNEEKMQQQDECDRTEYLQEWNK
jgi:hypothetical protein